MTLLRLLIILAMVTGCATVTAPTPTAMTQATTHSFVPATQTATPPKPPPTQTGSLYLENHQSFPIDVRIDGIPILKIGCNHHAQLTPGEAEVPSLPWRLSVRPDGGGLAFAGTVERLPQWYVHYLDGHGALSEEPVTVSGLEWARCPPPAPPSEQPSPCCSIGPIPTPLAGESRRESDAFWRSWANAPRGDLVFMASSLEEHFEQADLVMRGHITDIYVGEYWNWGRTLGPDSPIAYVIVAVSEVLKGDPISRTTGYVEVGLGSTSEEIIEELRQGIPEHDNVWFLMHDETIRPREVPNQTEIAPFAYLPVNDLQGVFRNIGGHVRLLKPHIYQQAFGPEQFPLSLEGTDYENLLHVLHELADSP